MGVDLGQSQDPSALSVVERTYERRRPLRFSVLVSGAGAEGCVVIGAAEQCTLVTDATGPGTPDPMEI